MIGAVELIARTAGPAVSSSARPALTFAVVDIAAAIGVHFGYVTLPPEARWLASMTMVVVSVVLAVVEVVAHHDREVAAVVRELHVDKALTAFGALSSAALLTALGVPTAAPSGVSAHHADMVEAVRLSAVSDAPAGMRFAAIGAGVGASLGLSWVRGKLLRALDHVHLSSIWARLETGGAVALMLTVVLAPVLAVVFIAVTVVAVLLLSLVVVLIDRARDAAARRPCPSCALPVRREASQCHRCRNAVAPMVHLGVPSQISKWGLGRPARS